MNKGMQNDQNNFGEMIEMVIKCYKRDYIEKKIQMENMS